MNGGVVLKVDAKQRYTTDAIGSFLIKKLIERKGGRVQTYEVRNDMYVSLLPPLYSYETVLNMSFSSFSQGLRVNSGT